MGLWSSATHERDSDTVKLNLLQTSIPLHPSKITNVRQYPLPAAAFMGIDRVVTELEERGIIKRTHSPYNSPVWLVQKRFTVDYKKLNANTAPLTVAFPNIAELVT